MRGLNARAQARRIGISLLFTVAGVSSSCLPRVARRGVACASAIQGFGKGGALSLVFIVQATAEEAHFTQALSSTGELLHPTTEQRKAVQEGLELSILL